MAVMTVLGKISADKLGITSPHEHLFIDLRNQFRPPSEITKKAVSEEKVSFKNIAVLRRNPLALSDNLLINDFDTAVSEALEFKKAGGDTIVDMSNIGLGRDPKALKAVARLTGLNIIAGCGYYYHDTHPADMDEKTVGDIANEMLTDLTVGIDDTNIKAGVIGEIGISEEMHPNERKVLEAAAKVQAETGVGVQVHVFAWNKKGPFPLGLDVLDIMEKNGADLRKVSINHVDVSMDLNMDYIMEIVKRGAMVEFDNFGHEFYVNREDRKFLPGPFATDYQRVVALKKLIDEGYISSILISTDICHKSLLHAYGGWGYDHILTNIIPMMQDIGISYEQAMVLLKDNPKNFLDSNII